MKTNRNAGYLYLLSFLEGGCVMASELIGAKMLAPYFGTSLYVWASALGITLGGLMVGYFLGGFCSRRTSDNLSALYLVLISAAAFLFLMPFTSRPVMTWALGLPLQWGASLSLLAFMFPPLVFMGMASPLIINVLTRDPKDAGRCAGNIYAISTLGGILATFLFGFYIIPEFGISRPAMISGLCLAILPSISLLRRKRKVGGLAACLAMFLTLTFVPTPGMAHTSGGVIVYYSEGVMGQLKVIDRELPGDGEVMRSLMVNNTTQTTVLRDAPLHHHFWPYSQLIEYLASAYSPGSHVLLLGMGGGTLVHSFEALGFQQDIVEIDQRIKDVAITYFGLHERYDVIIDDARHVVRMALPGRYDLIVYDVFKGESAPHHILTQEALGEVGRVLNADGALLINFYGYLDGDVGRLTRSVAKTLLNSGFELSIYMTPGLPDQRNSIMAAWRETQPSPFERSKLGRGEMRLAYDPGPRPLPHLGDAVVLTDDQPQLRLFANAAMQWRRLSNANLLSHVN